MFFILLIMFATSNLIVLYSLTKYSLIKKQSNEPYLYALMASAINLGLSPLYGSVGSNNCRYFIFLIVAIAGFYSMVKLYRNYVIPRIKLKRRLTREEQLALPIKTYEKLIGIGFYCLSVISSTVLIFLNAE